MYADKPVRQFTDELASAAPVPGGGAAAALTGALAAALVSMVCHLTLGRPRFAAVAAEVQAILERSEAARTRLLHLIDADAAAYSAVAAALRQPRTTPEEKAARAAALQTALRQATEPPLAVARTAAEVLELAAPLVEKSNPSVLSDVGTAALLAEAALEGAILNVEVNLASLDDPAFVTSIRQETDRLRQTAHGRGYQIAQQVLDRLRRNP